MFENNSAILEISRGLLAAFFALYVHQFFMNVRMAYVEKNRKHEGVNRALFSLFCGLFCFLELLITYAEGSQPRTSLIYFALYFTAIISFIFYMKAMNNYYLGGDKFRKIVIGALIATLIPHTAASLYMIFVDPSFDYFSWLPGKVPNPILAACWGDTVFSPSPGFILMAMTYNLTLFAILTAMLLGYLKGKYRDSIILFGVSLSILSMTHEMVTSTFMPEFYFFLIFAGNYPEIARVTFLNQKRMFVRLGLEIEKNKRLAAIKQREIEQARFRAVSSLATGIAHEINNPLTVISITSSLLKRSAANQNLNDNILENSSNKIKENVERIANIIQGLQVLGKTVSHGKEQAHSFKSIVNDLKGIISASFKQKGVDLQVVYKENCEDAILYCDKVKVVKALFHLAENALEAAKESDEKWVRLEVSRGEAEDVFKIFDSGEKRIEADVRDKMFDPFFTTKDIGAGSGLGLTAAKSLIEENLGTLELNPQSPETCFIVSLKRHLEESDPA